ncbi:MAG: hypothetical protein U5N86_00395 [Planctomycetota bacterium]|nr:hypothetical protein [Planctomycetota bacterium]
MATRELFSREKNTIEGNDWELTDAGSGNGPSKNGLRKTIRYRIHMCDYNGPLRRWIQGNKEVQLSDSYIGQRDENEHGPKCGTFIRCTKIWARYTAYKTTWNEDGRTVDWANTFQIGGVYTRYIENSREKTPIIDKNELTVTSDYTGTNVDCIVGYSEKNDTYLLTENSEPQASQMQDYVEVKAHDPIPNDRDAP